MQKKNKNYSSCKNCLLILGKMKAWRDSATLILAARQGRKCSDALSDSAFQYDYKLLNLKRHKNATFMPGSYVFPGGVTEPSDADLKWNKLFSSFGFDSNSFTPLFAKNTLRPPIFKARRNELPREISLRITAIRETFEESGVLMCRRAAKKGTLTEWAESMVVDDLQNWQGKVHNDATEFYRMCEGLQCYPDIWALHEWSNWLTPTTFAKRFDTIFYMACTPIQPLAEFESQEMDGLKWLSPHELLSSLKKYQVQPPQHYEAARIAKFESLDNLLDFAVARSKIGVHLNFPVKIRLSDGYVMVFPGDSMYPKEVSLTDKLVLDRTHMTMAEFREASPVKNRMELYSLDVITLNVENFDSKDGHLSPFPVETVQPKTAK